MTTPLPLSPFVTEPDARFVLDVDAFLAEIEPAPAFLSNPAPDFLRATDLMPIVEIIRGHAR